MVQLYLDAVTGRITGYNTIIPYGYVDENLVGDGILPSLAGLAGGQALYYADGQVTGTAPAIGDGGLCGELEAVNREIAGLAARAGTGNKAFMDNIIGGMSLEEAREAAAKDREELQKLEGRRDILGQEYKELACSIADRRFQQEEERAGWEYFLSMATVVRDENGYLEEWVRYHIEQVGFEHFYIYDNESSVPVKDYLESVNFKYMDRLTIIPWGTSRATQEDSHNHFLKNYAQGTKWFLAADPDEYVYIKDGSRTLREFLEANSQYATIKCLWRHFNANGQVSKTAGTDMERFTQETGWEGWKHGGKKFAQSNRVSRFRSYVPVERMGARALGYGDGAAKDFFQLNHYVTRSWEEWQQKIRRGSSNPGYRRKLSMFFELNPDMAYLDTGEDMEQGYGPAQEGGGDGGREIKKHEISK